MSTKRYALGVTLIELVVAMAIIGIIATGVAVMMNKSSAGADPVRRKQALLIAEGLMDEVLSAHYTFCDPLDDNAGRALGAALGTDNCSTTVEVIGPEAGNARPFDNVNDYGPSFSFTNGTGQVVDANGNAMTSGGYTATVAINPVLPVAARLGPPLPAATGIFSDATPGNMNAILITVTVTYGTAGGDFIRLDAYRTRYAPRDF